jgi:hypothetical protein
MALKSASHATMRRQLEALKTRLQQLGGDSSGGGPATHIKLSVIGEWHCDLERGKNEECLEIGQR